MNRLRLWQAVGYALSFVGVVFALMQLTRCDWLPPCIACTYLALLLVPGGLLLVFWENYGPGVSKRREVSKEELRSLFAEVDRLGQSSEEHLDLARTEVDRIRGLSGPPLELDVLPLRQAITHLYPDHELVSRVRYELRLLKEYTDDDDPDLYDDWDRRLQKLMREVESPEPGLAVEEQKERRAVALERLRAELKTLRESVAQYDKTYAEGELIFKRVLYWTVCASFVALAVGLLPIIHVSGDQILKIQHWAAIGVAGALLSVLVAIRDPSIPELGETNGKFVLERAILSVAIGGLAAVALFGALSAGIISGKIFPQVPILARPSDPNFWLQTGGSIFWAFFAGFSIKIFSAMVRVAEGQSGSDRD